MHVDGRAKFCEAPRRAGMIEMDVAEENVPDILDTETSFRKLGDHSLKGRFRSGIEKDESFIGLQQSGSDDTGATEMSSIKDVDHGMSESFFFSARR